MEIYTTERLELVFIGFIGGLLVALPLFTGI